MFNSDKPIESQQEDVLGRASFADNLGKAILSYNNKESLVVGLYGKWGSGKSSVINICIQFIESYPVETDNQLPIILKFNPWNYSDQNQLIQQFFNELSAILRKNIAPEKSAQIGKKLLTYSAFFKPLKYIPIVGRYSEMAVEIVEMVGEATKSAGEPKELSEIKSELNELLIEQNIKIVVIVDDIDRLNNQEIRQIFQLIKSLGDFNNTIYLLAFDKEVVINALGKVQEGSGEEYLEKIIQVPFELPVITDKDLEQLLFSKLDQILKDVPEKLFDQTYWGNIYYSGLRQFFKNIRDINRYCNSLSFGFKLIKDEVNPIDFMVITAIQTFLPNVYYGIRANKDLFSGVMNSYSRSDREKLKYKELYDQITQGVSGQYQIRELFERIFPKLESIIGNTNYGHDWLAGWRRSKRICSPDCFDAYFKLSLPKGDFSSKEMEAIINLTINQEKFQEATYVLIREDRISRFLELLVDYTEVDIPLTNIKTICLVIMNIGDKLSNSKSGIFGLSDNNIRISRVFYQLFWRYNSTEERSSLIHDVILSTSESIYTLVYFVSRLRREHGKDTDDIREPIEKLTVNEDQLSIIESAIIEKLIQWSQDGKLLQHKEMVSLLYSWKRFGREEELTNFVQGIKKEDRKLIAFISGFIYEVSSTTMGDHVSKHNWEIHKENISDFLEIGEIENRIKIIVEDEIYPDMIEKEKLSLSLFLRTNI